MRSGSRPRRRSRVGDAAAVGLEAGEAEPDAAALGVTVATAVADALPEGDAVATTVDIGAGDAVLTVGGGPEPAPPPQPQIVDATTGRSQSRRNFTSAPSSRSVYLGR